MRAWWISVLIALLLSGCAGAPREPEDTAEATTRENRDDVANDPFLDPARKAELLAKERPAKTPTPEPLPPLAPRKETRPEDLTDAELRSVLEHRYKDLSYAWVTRDLDAMMAFNARPYKEEGKEISLQEQRKSYQEDIQWMNSLEKETGTTLRFAVINEILELTRKTPDRAVARVRCTFRARNVMDGATIEVAQETRDVWIHQAGAWRFAEVDELTEVSERKFVADVQPIEEEAPPPPPQPSYRRPGYPPYGLPHNQPQVRYDPPRLPQPYRRPYRGY